MRVSDRSLPGAFFLLALTLLPSFALGTDLMIVPPTTTAAMGAVASVSLQLATAVNLSGFQAKATFDPAILEVTYLAINPGFDRILRKSFDNATGQISLAAVSLSNPPLSATGLSLATISFRVKGGGSSNIALSKVVLGNQDGEEISATLFTGSVAALGDFSAPTVTAFGVPALTTSLQVAVSNFNATDNLAVTGYLVSELAAAPDPGAGGWSDRAPTSYLFASSGRKTLYGWAKDAAGNVSAPATAPVTVVTLPGDCDYSGSVIISEVQGAVRMFLGLDAPLVCVDTDGSGKVGITELQRVLNSFLKP